MSDCEQKTRTECGGKPSPNCIWNSEQSECISKKSFCNDNKYKAYCDREPMVCTWNDDKKKCVQK